MMKKLLVLMLVLGISSVASAGVIDLEIVSLNGEIIPATDYIEIAESDWVNIDIMYDTAMEGQYLSQLSVEVTVGGLGTLDMTALTYPPGVWDMDTQFSPGITEVVPGKQYLVQYSEGMAGSGAYPGIAIDHLLLHCDQGEPENIVTLTLADVLLGSVGSMENPFGIVGMGLTIGPGVTILNVPEPMTLALLGLGGLFLIRRRK
jgi:hypothetical protein